MKLPTFQFNRHSVKYMLFDLAVIISCIAVAAAHRLWFNGNSSISVPECDAAYDEGEISSNINQTKGTPILSRTTIPHSSFVVGETVEVYDPNILPSNVFFAEIESTVSKDDGSIKYDVRMGQELDDIYRDIEGTRIRAHDPYGYMTRALCNLGFPRSNRKDFPCIILSKSAPSPAETYYVMVAYKNDQLKYVELPLPRVHPFVNGGSSTSFEKEFDSMTKYLNHTTPRQENDVLRGLVELYNPVNEHDSIVAPAIITDYSNGVYNVKHTMHNLDYRGVKPRFLRPYEVIESGTKAICNDGSEKDLSLIECTVVSHFMNKNAILMYKVAYWIEQKEYEYDSLKLVPSTKVQRALGA
mmetsp:Transcript_44562/g.93516  ORF Transcript_44562/g.93516 Transcript_44562/m.93516 type:complete len:356 (-) Transcript_44562:91-1158(-)